MTTTTVARPHPAAVRRTGRRLGLYALQVRTEVAAARRNVEYVVGLVVVPTLLYVMFGLPNSNVLSPGGNTFATLAVGSFGAYGVVSLAIFTFGDEVAKERGRGWIRTLRATPVPAGAYLVGKLSMAAVYAVLIAAGLAAASVPTGRADMSATTWLWFTLLLVGGVLAFSTFGLALAFLVRPRAATAIANLVFLPLSFSSGFFFPPSELPAFLHDVTPFLPTYHFGMLVWRVIGTEGDLLTLTGFAPEPIAVHVTWVVGSMIAGAVIALLAARRAAVTRR